MSGGFLGLPNNPWSGSPMQSLTDLSAAGAAVPTVLPPPMPDPATTGAIPPAGPSPAAAPAAPSRGFGDVLSDAFSGRGIMGARPGDDVVDPSTGATAGQMRQASMGSMMQMGLTLMAAGSRMSDDSRAAMLARIPSALGNSDQINSFAMARLKMAEARMAERKQAQAEAKQAHVLALLGGSGAATLPSAPAATPGTIAPIAASAAMGAGSVPAAAVAPGPAATPSLAPPGPSGGATAGMSPGEVAAIAGMDSERALETIARRRGELDGQETFGTPYADPATGQQMVPVLKGGRQVRVQSLGTLQSRVTEEDGRRVTRQGGAVTGIQDVPEDPQDREERTASVSLRKDRFKALGEARVSAQTAVAQYDRLSAAEMAVREGKTIAGFGATQRTQIANMLNSLGILNPEGEKVVATGNVQALFEQSGGEFAKQYYGPQISNADVENARRAIGGIQSNAPEVVADALSRIKAGARRTVEAYNADVTSHNGRLSGIRSEGLRGDLTALPVEKDFEAAQPDRSAVTPDMARAELARRRGAQAGTVPDAAVAHLRANPGLRDAFDAKYGAGAAARALGR